MHEGLTLHTQRHVLLYDSILKVLCYLWACQTRTVLHAQEAQVCS